MYKMQFRKGLGLKHFLFFIKELISLLSENRRIFALLLIMAGILCFVINTEVYGAGIPEPKAKVTGVFYNNKFYKCGETYDATAAGVTYTCVACGDCFPKKQASTSGTGYGGYSKQNFQMQLMQGFMGALFQSIFAPPAHDPYAEQLKQQQELLKKHEEEKKKQHALDAWKKLQADEADRLSAEEAQKKKQGDALLAKMGSGSSGGGLRPFNWDAPRAEFKPLGPGTFPTSHYEPWQQLLCASHFSAMALNSRDPESAAFMNRQADAVATGGMTEVECSFPAMPQVPQPQEHAEKMQKITTILENVQVKIKDLQDIEAKLTEAKQQKQEAETRLKDAEAKISEIKNRSLDASKPDVKAQDDDLLLQQALAELGSAQEQLGKAEQNEQKYEEMKNRNLDEIKNMEQQAMKEFGKK